MGKTETKKILLSKLQLNLENPRFESVGSEKEAINLMIETLAAKLIKLAKDILENELNPADLIQVTPNRENKFTVLEGNRRITALKLLRKPSLIERRHISFYKKIKPLSDQFNKKPSQKILCVIFHDPIDSDKWIELKHTGENDGVGTVQWDSTQQARFTRKRKGQTPIALQAIEFLSRSEFTDTSLKEDLGKLPYTNIERLLTDPDIRDILGLSYKEKNLETVYKEEEIVKGLSKIARDFLYRNYTVNQVRNKKDRLKYIEEFSENDLPQKPLATNSIWRLTSAKNLSMDIENEDLSPIPHKPKDISSKRKCLIPKDCIIKITDRRPNKIYHELKTLNINDFENAVAVTFRVFVELTVDAFIESKQGQIKGVKKMTAFKEKVQRTIDYFQSAQILNDHQLKGIRVLINERDGILSIDTFNAYVHNRVFFPKADHLMNSWNDIQIFIEKIWQNVDDVK